MVNQSSVSVACPVDCIEPILVVKKKKKIKEVSKSKNRNVNVSKTKTDIEYITKWPTIDDLISGLPCSQLPRSEKTESACTIVA